MSDFIAIPEPATPEYPEQIKMIMPGEFAAGGPGGPANVQAAGLVRRTQWLKEHKEDKVNKGKPGGYVPLDEDGKVPAGLLPKTSAGTISGVVPVANGGTGNTVGNAPSAAKLATARKISLTGAITGSASFDGTSDISISTSHADASLLMPKGVILMWSGVLSAIPSGWALCDGTGGTPNLVDKFVKGISTKTTNPGAVGGSHSKALSVENIPSHNHIFNGKSHAHAIGNHTHLMNHGHDNTFAVKSEGAHTHAFSGTASSSGAHTHSVKEGSKDPETSGNLTSGDDYTNILYKYSSTTSNGAHTHTVSATILSNGDHTHTITGAVTNHAGSTGSSTPTCSTDATEGTIGNTGSGATFDNRPAFYELAYIMKL